MNKEIDYVVSITTAAQLDATGQWILSGGLPQTPDEAVVRQITYSSVAIPEVLVIDSSIGQMGSVLSTNAFTACPQTRLQLRNPLPQSITFQMRAFDRSPADTDLDYVSLAIDFIKYRK